MPVSAGKADAPRGQPARLSAALSSQAQRHHHRPGSMQTTPHGKLERAPQPLSFVLGYDVQASPEHSIKSTGEPQSEVLAVHSPRPSGLCTGTRCDAEGWPTAHAPCSVCGPSFVVVRNPYNTTRTMDSAFLDIIYFQYLRSSLFFFFF